MANDSLSSVYKEFLFGGWSLVALLIITIKKLKSL